MSDAQLLDFVENSLVVDVATTGSYANLSPDHYQGVVVCESDWRLADN
jgi:hypothetical protein